MPFKMKADQPGNGWFAFLSIHPAQAPVFTTDILLHCDSQRKSHSFQLKRRQL